MPEFENLLYETLDDGRICKVTLNRPEKLNALSNPLLMELGEALHDAEGDPEVRVVILAGAGRAFCAGYDLTTARHPYKGRRYPSRDDKGRPLVGGMRTSMVQVTDVLLYFWNMAKVTIAQVGGYCVAGGGELAMMADLVIAGDDATFGHPGTRGLGTPRNGCIWPFVIPMRQAKELMFTGDSISAQRALEINMVNAVVPRDDLEEYTLNFARRIGTQDADSLAVHKHALNRYYEHMGIYPALRAGTDFDALYQFTGFAYKWYDKFNEAMESGGGFKEALAWRDGPYQDYRAALDHVTKR